ncbi:MAG: ATP-binding protein [Bacilli bacterium]|nr:ATP-binding protein [Bacilli bacterium]
MKHLIALCAIPASGKSTYAKHYKINHKDENVFIVSSDEIRKELTGVYSNLEHEKDVWEIYFKRINILRDSNSDCTIIADSTNITNKHRQILGKLPGFDKKTLVVISKELPVILERNRQRDHAKYVPEAAIKEMWDEWEKVDKETAELFDEVIYIEGWFDKAAI